MEGRTRQKNRPDHASEHKELKEEETALEKKERHRKQITEAKLQ